MWNAVVFYWCYNHRGVSGNIKILPSACLFLEESNFRQFREGLVLLCPYPVSFCHDKRGHRWLTIVYLQARVIKWHVPTKNLLYFYLQFYSEFLFVCYFHRRTSKNAFYFLSLSEIEKKGRKKGKRKIEKEGEKDMTSLAKRGAAFSFLSFRSHFLPLFFLWHSCLSAMGTAGITRRHRISSIMDGEADLILFSADIDSSQHWGFRFSPATEDDDINKLTPFWVFWACTFFRVRNRK